MKLEKQLEFDFAKENLLTDIKPYVQKGLEYAKYTALGLGMLALGALLLPIEAATRLYDSLDEDNLYE